MPRNSNRNDYITYIKDKSDVSYKDIANHFGIKLSTCYANIRNYGLKDFVKNTAIPDGFEEYCSTHTADDVAIKFAMQKRRVYYLCRVKGINILKRTGHRSKNRRKCMLSGSATDMIRTLSDTYSYAAIGDVFGYSREYIRQICSNSQ